MQLKSRRREFLEGARDSLPLIIGAIPFGIIFGTLSGGAGLSVAGTIGMSVFVFAGSAQFVAMGLVAAGTAWPMIVVTTFVVNFRHLLYTATLLPYLRKLSPRWQAILAFGLTDETFAVAVGRWHAPDQSPHKHWYQLGSMTFMYTNWNICTLVGVVAGRWLQEIGNWGLDFAMIAAFIGMVLPYAKDRPHLSTILVAAVGSIVFHGLPHKLGLIVAAILGIFVGVVVDLCSEKTDGLSAASAEEN